MTTTQVTYDELDLQGKVAQQIKIGGWHLNDGGYEFDSGFDDDWGQEVYDEPEEVKLIEVVPTAGEDEDDWDSEEFEVTFQAPNGTERTYLLSRDELGVYV